MFTNKLYDVLKFLALLAFPALGTLYFTLAQIWNLPAAEEVVSTIVAVDTFLGVILQISAKSYDKSDAKFDGDLVVSKHGDKTVHTLQLREDTALDKIHEKDELRFKVDKVREVKKSRGDSRSKHRV